MLAFEGSQNSRSFIRDILMFISAEGPVLRTTFSTTLEVLVDRDEEAPNALHLPPIADERADERAVRAIQNEVKANKCSSPAPERNHHPMHLLRHGS